MSGDVLRKTFKELRENSPSATQEDFNLKKLGSNPGKFKRLVTKHLGAKAAEKIDKSDGDRIMAKAKRTDNTKLYRQGSFIKNFYGRKQGKLMVKQISCDECNMSFKVIFEQEEDDFTHEVEFCPFCSAIVEESSEDDTEIIYD